MNELLLEILRNFGGENIEFDSTPMVYLGATSEPCGSGCSGSLMRVYNNGPQSVTVHVLVTYYRVEPQFAFNRRVDTILVEASGSRVVGCGGQCAGYYYAYSIAGIG
jgi:hypothetical protein